MTVTKRGEPIAIITPATGTMGKYAKLVAEGKLRLSRFTTDDIRSFVRHPTEVERSPIQTILDMRDEDAERALFRLLRPDQPCG